MCIFPKLSPRLEAVAGMVRPGGVVADIGTDHAYLPAFLVNTGHNPKAFACDVSEGPLRRAGATLKTYGVEDKVELMLSDGLDGVDFADDVVVSGMGGGLIAKILGRCAFIRDPRVSLVLQPMTAAPGLREFLCLSGFEINKEVVAAEGAKLYVVMAVTFTGVNFTQDAFFCLTGRLPLTGGPLEQAYLLREAGKLDKKARGLRESRRRQPEAGAVEALASKIRETALNCVSGGT